MRRHWCLLLIAGIAAGCAEVPEINPEIGSAAARQKPEIVGAKGPLSPRQINALLARLAPGQSGALERHLAVEQAVAETPLVEGNRTEVLKDGPATLRAMFAAMHAARRHIELEYFIFEDIESDGEHLGDLLLAKRQQGVEIDIIYDSYGSLATPQEFIDRLATAGIKLLQFNPLNPVEVKNVGYSPNARDHRKILLTDGATAIVGGVNLSTAYSSSVPFRSRPQAGSEALPWRDTDLLIEGPAAARLEQLFLEHWQAQHGPPLAADGLFPRIAAKGREVVRIIGSTPENVVRSYYATLLSAIRSATSTVWLSTAYFAPTHQEMEALIGAARRGVDVRLLLPDKSDSDLSIAVQHSRYDDLLEAGVQLFETHDEVLHSKTITVDGVWSAIGSSNFDHRSVIFNDEVDAVVIGSETARQLAALFSADLAGASQVRLDAWRQRPLGDRIKELFARSWQALL